MGDYYLPYSTINPIIPWNSSLSSPRTNQYRPLLIPLLETQLHKATTETKSHPSNHKNRNIYIHIYIYKLDCKIDKEPTMPQRLSFNLEFQVPTLGQRHGFIASDEEKRFIRSSINKVEIFLQRRRWNSMVWQAIAEIALLSVDSPKHSRWKFKGIVPDGEETKTSRLEGVGCRFRNILKRYANCQVYINTSISFSSQHPWGRGGRDQPARQVTVHRHINPDPIRLDLESAGPN